MSADKLNLIKTPHRYLGKILILIGFVILTGVQYLLPNGFIWVEAVGAILLLSGSAIDLRYQKDDSYMQYGLALLLVMYLIILFIGTES